MAKKQTNYVCQQCGAVSPSFLGKCPECGSWNSLVETLTSYNLGKSDQQLATHSTRFARSGQGVKLISLSEIRSEQISRVSTGISELDRVLGGGIVPGMAILLAGEPGIGKSTLLLELTKHWSNSANLSNLVSLYVAGEESASQIKVRAERLAVVTQKAIILESTDVDAIVHVVQQVNLQVEKQVSQVSAGKLSGKIGLVIVDSIQTLTTTDLEGPAGSVGQVRECAARLIKTTKELGLPLILVGHVTKEGTIAGPKVLEHIVDTILTVEGDRFEGLRIVRTTKNRFGPTDEVGLFSMTDAGLKTVDSADLTNLTDLANLPGSCLTVSMEGTRPMVVEIQALVTSSPLPAPRRVASGVDYNRLQMGIAILQKRLNVPLFKEDVYVSVSSGLKISEPAADLAMALAILSSFRNKALTSRLVAIGELDLLGNVRRVNNLERRVKEAKAMKLNNIISPDNLKSLTDFKL